MQQTRRRQSMNYFSPAASSNRKWQDPCRHHLPITEWSAAIRSDEDDNGSSASGYSDSKRSSNALLMAAFVGAGECHRGSSFGSCPTWNTFDKCPTTPSPICSPLSSFSCGSGPSPSYVTPNQSSEKEEEESRRACNASLQKRFNSSIPKPRFKEITRAGPTGEQLSYGRNKCYDADDDERRLPTVSEGHEDDRGCNQSCCLTISSHMSSGSEGEICSGFENSDVESYIGERPVRQGRPGRSRDYDVNLEVEARGNKLEEKLSEWKQTKMMKIMETLRREEAAIDRWEKKKTTEARNEMKKTEAKLDKQWSRDLIKMQRRIRSAQKEAEKKKIKERASAAKKIAKVTAALAKTAATGKLPWWFHFL